MADIGKQRKRSDHKIRAVIDTNLFVSGIFATHSLSATLQDLWIEQEFILVTSVEIMREVGRVLNYPRIRKRFQPKEETLRRFFKLVFRKAVVTRDIYKTDFLDSDPSDNKFLACALEGKADFIITRDQHLRDLKYFHGIQIIGVKAFLRMLRESSGANDLH